MSTIRYMQKGRLYTHRDGLESRSLKEGSNYQLLALLLEGNVYLPHILKKYSIRRPG